MHLAELLHEQGAELTVADINSQAATLAAEKLEAVVVPSHSIHKADVDIFAPCALGAVLNEGTIPEIRALAIVGAANNQLANEADGARLMARGILYAPDYVVNAGGVINVAGEYFKNTTDQVRAKVERIGERLLDVLARAEELGVPTNIAADLMALEIILKQG
jgi:leucine dehydrogenase